MLRPTPGDSWGVQQHHWDTGAKQNQQMNPGGPSNRQKSSDPNQPKLSVQENFDLLTCFIQDSADKHIPSKTSRSVSSIPWITLEIRRKIRRKNKTHAKAKKTDNSKLKSKFQTLRREIKADVRTQHDLVSDVKAKPRDFYRYINNQKKDT